MFNLHTFLYFMNVGHYINKIYLFEGGNKPKRADSRSVQIGMSCIGISIGQLLSHAENLAQEITRFQCTRLWHKISVIELIKSFHLVLEIEYLFFNVINISLLIIICISYFQPLLLLLCFSIWETSSTYCRFGVL